MDVNEKRQKKREEKIKKEIRREMTELRREVKWEEVRENLEKWMKSSEQRKTRQAL